jgi:hypothetical protein
MKHLEYFLFATLTVAAYIGRQVFVEGLDLEPLFSIAFGAMARKLVLSRPIALLMVVIIIISIGIIGRGACKLSESPPRGVLGIRTRHAGWGPTTTTEMTGA